MNRSRKAADISECRAGKLVALPIKGLILATLIATSVPANSQPVREVPASRLTAKNRQQIERMLTTELQQAVNRQKRIVGQGKYATVKATLDTSRHSLIIDLSRSYVPKYNGAEYEDLKHELETIALDLLEGVVFVKGVEFQFDGKDIYHYIPEVTQPAPPRRVNALSEANRTVVVAGGHGLYFHHGFNDWRPQRDPSNGVTEDFITPYFVTDLKSSLIARSGVAVGNPRSTSTLVHSSSGQAWWKVGARYYLQGVYPSNPEIWHSLPGAVDSLRERDEDIRARPLFANHIGANALIHIHTNAGDPSASGTRVYHQQGRAEDAQLGSSILCYMREQIQAVPAYATFPMSAVSREGDYGETRLATMPSVIVEVGFHTNPTDAAALQDSRFRAAAMRGVEKGYRLTSEGRTDCTPFAISSIPSSSGTYYQYFPVKYFFKGYPRFPVTLKTVSISCPSGWTCGNKSKSYTSATASQLTYDFYCTAQPTAPAATFKWRTTLTDADGVVTASVDHSTACSPG